VDLIISELKGQNPQILPDFCDFYTPDGQVGLNFFWQITSMNRLMTAINQPGFQYDRRMGVN
jgi:hypothetical protein